MSYFASHFWGEKSHGFEVLYQNMKQGQVSAKELADFVRERAAVEESYAKSMAKMSKLAGSGTQLGTFAPLWEVFRISSDKLALCHLELARRLQDLLRDVGRYAEEQVRTHKKSKEEVSGTLEAVQALAGATQALPKAREAFHGRGAELERLRREGAGPKEIEKAELKSRKAAEGLRRAAEKYNSARSEFERKMRDSAAVKSQRGATGGARPGRRTATPITLPSARSLAALPGSGGGPPGADEGPDWLLRPLGGGRPRPGRAGEGPENPMEILFIFIEG
uniref:F-BAR domain-containing protein n=1 Tax=Anolis carolinensis TaxID=28377 RepID=H9GPQ4_ANOCA